MKTRLHTADVLTFTLTGAEPQRPDIGGPA